MKRIAGSGCPIPEPFFTYFGGKHRLAGYYPTPSHQMVIEPFAGSAAYSTVHYQRDVLLYDVDPVICGVWDWLIKATPADVLRLPCYLEDVSEVNACQEAKWLIGFWLKGGSEQPVTKPSPRMQSKMFPDSCWGSVIRHRIAKNVTKIKHWKVVNASFETAPNQLATWFIDPPYQRSGKAYKHSDVDYVVLKDWASSRSGQVICCGQPGDDWARFVPFKRTRNVFGGSSIEMISVRS